MAHRDPEADSPSVLWADAEGWGWLDGLSGESPVSLAALDERVLLVGESRGGGARVELRGAAMDAPVALPTGLAGGCRVSLAGRPGAVLVAGLRGAPGCTAGAPQVQMLGPGGTLLRPMTALHPDAEFTVQSVRARWDFGRFVVRATTTEGGEPLAWVLDPSGEPLSTATGEVACAASGCVRVTVSGASVGSGMLRVEPLLAGEAWDTGIRAQDVTGLAVSGDRLLVMGASVNGTQGCALSVLHLGQRRVLLEHHDEALSCDPGRVLATPLGFVLAEQEPGRSARLRTIGCEG